IPAGVLLRRIMLVVNFSHPLTPAQQARITELTGRPVERVIEVLTQLDAQQPFAEQVCALIDQAGLSAAEWQSAALPVNLPSFSPIACLLLAELHGRAG